jgi:23S rRNA (uracil1939-C5)-methyltransferase
VLVESVAYGGAGVARLDGRVIFIHGPVVPGELVLVRLTSQRKRYAEGHLERVLEASEQRIRPRCPWFGECGGCAYQHVGYDLQLRWKSGQVAELFRRVAKINAPPIEETVPSPRAWGYRNRIRLHVREGRMGFYRRQSAELVEVERCAIATDSVNQSLSELRGGRDGERFRDGERTVSERPGIKFFEQTNDGAAEKLLEVVGEMVPEGEEGWLVDAYCGAGWFARGLSSRFSQVVGIESHGGAVAEARRLGGARERYVCGPVEDSLGEVLSSLQGRESAGLGTLLVDPPEAGLSSRVREAIAALGPRRMIYVSCDPATQARDVGELVRAGYVLRRLVPVDMFPQTADIEVVALMERER